MHHASIIELICFGYLYPQHMRDEIWIYWKVKQTDQAIQPNLLICYIIFYSNWSWNTSYGIYLGFDLYQIYIKFNILCFLGNTNKLRKYALSNQNWPISSVSGSQHCKLNIYIHKIF